MSVKITDLCHTYMEGSPFQTTAIHDINLEIADGEFIGIIGHTGSGKSTLIQHLNGLLKPGSGTIHIDGINLWGKGADMHSIRKRVGLVFQYPEYQLFEETVALDIAFGPKNLGLGQHEIDARVLEAAQLVGLSDDALKKSPFELSGGQKRRCAIAGVLAMRPELLILDEPTAGLDPRGREDMLALLKKLHTEQNITMIMVSHAMQDVATLCSRILVMDHGQIKMSGTPEQVFKKGDELIAMGLGLPDGTRLARALKGKGFDIPENLWKLSDLEKVLLSLLKGGKADA